MKIDYAKLEEDFRAAAEAARKVRSIDGDGGSSNMDDITLMLERGQLAKVKAAAKPAGLYVSRRFAGAFSVSLLDTDSQGYNHTAKVEAAVQVLKARGWDVSLTYRTD